MSIISQLPSSTTFPSGRIDDATFTLSSSKQRIFHPDSPRNFNATLPISRIPVELLCEIFSIFITEPSQLESNDGPGPLVSRRSLADPMILGQVYSRWRNVALNFPMIWSTIVIPKPKKSGLHLTKLWLERAKNQLLSLTLVVVRRDDVDIPAIQEFLSAFTSRSAFWKKIDFILPLDVIVPFHQMVLDAHRCNNLESVRFTAPFSVSQDLRQFTMRTLRDCACREDIWTFFNSSPALHDVTWRHFYETITPRLTPFEQLTTVNLLQVLNADDFFAVLSQFPNIRDLQASIYPVISREESLIRPPTLPLTVLSLRKLQICIKAPTKSIFSNITLPALQDLHMSSDGYFATHSLHDPSSFQAFLQRSDCRLRKLTLSGDDITEECLEEYLTLAELRWLTHFDFGKEVLDRTISLFLQENSDGAHVILPRLRDLHLGSCDTTDGLLSRMISSRSRTSLVEGQIPPQGALETFRISTEIQFGPIDEEFFTKYKII